MAAEYAVFRRGLDALAGLRLAGLALSLYFLESLFAVILLIALVSYVASGLWLFYRARDTRLLLAAPLPLGGLYALRALETFALTSWPLLIVGAPALVALGRAHDQDAAFYLAGGGTLALFAVFTGAGGRSSRAPPAPRCGARPRGSPWASPSPSCWRSSPWPSGAT
ncbi:MAG: hypothetical protein HY729_13615 [Candidatus Rokubacteria bacterium]|nr:hypothetical protein [Candidatus Rokubacteria bacterium]